MIWPFFFFYHFFMQHPKMYNKNKTKHADGNSGGQFENSTFSSDVVFTGHQFPLIIRDPKVLI